MVHDSHAVETVSALELAEDGSHVSESIGADCVCVICVRIWTWDVASTTSGRTTRPRHDLDLDKVLQHPPELHAPRMLHVPRTRQRTSDTDNTLNRRARDEMLDDIEPVQHDEQFGIGVDGGLRDRARQLHEMPDELTLLGGKPAHRFVVGRVGGCEEFEEAGEAVEQVRRTV